MSDGAASRDPRRFFDLFASGEKRADDIDDFISAWHAGPSDDATDLHDFLGMSWPEYAAWLEGSPLGSILASRRTGHPLQRRPMREAGPDVGLSKIA